MQASARSAPDDVEKIVVHGSQVTVDHVGWKYVPQGLTSAQLNLPYCVATLLLEGDVLRRPVHRGQGRGSRSACAGGEGAGRSTTPRSPRAVSKFRHMVRVEVFLRDGTVLERTVEAGRGNENDFASEADIVDKFDKLATHSCRARRPSDRRLDAGAGAADGRRGAGAIAGEGSRRRRAAGAASGLRDELALAHRPAGCRGLAEQRGVMDLHARPQRRAHVLRGGAAGPASSRRAIAFRLQEPYRQNMEAIKNILVATPDNQHLPLSQFADIKVSKGASFIYRESTRASSASSSASRGAISPAPSKTLRRKWPPPSTCRSATPSTGAASTSSISRRARRWP